MILIERNLLKNKFRLLHMILFIIYFSINFCFAAPTLSLENRSTFLVNVEPIDNEKAKLLEGGKSNSENVVVEQMQNNPPTASRPRFPSPKPNPEPVPLPAERGFSND